MKVVFWRSKSKKWSSKLLLESELSVLPVKGDLMYLHNSRTHWEVSAVVHFIFAKSQEAQVWLDTENLHDNE